MELEKKVPMRRFEGFTDEWEERELGDIADFNPHSILPEQFEYVDLESVVGTELISHRTETKKSAPSRAQRLAKNGDVFYQTVRPYQKNNYLFDLLDVNYVFSTGYAQMRPYIDSYFLFSRLQEDRFVTKVLDRCTGTSYPAISSNDLAKIKISVPSIKKEQIKIGKFFNELDDSITIQQRKLEKTKALKSAYLDEMFPAEGERVPKRRFEEFKGDWVEHRFGELYNIVSGYAFKMSDYIKRGIPIINGESIQHGSISPNNMNYLPKSFIEKHQSSILKTGDIVLGLNRPITNGNLKIAQVPEELHGSLLYQRAGKIIILNNSDINFSYQLLGVEVLKFVLEEAVGSDQPFISTTKLKEWPIYIPELEEEQQKIGNFFKQLDTKITTEQQKLNKLKSLKQAYLNEMFV